MFMRDWFRLWHELTGKLGAFSTLRYLLPVRGNLAFVEMLDRFDLGFRRFYWVDPSKLEIAYHIVGDLKRQKGLPVLPGDGHKIIDAFLAAFPLTDSVDKSISNSWHYKLLEDYYRNDGKIDFRATAYYQFYKSLEGVGLFRGDAFYIGRCKRLVNLCERIKEEGFIYPYLESHVCVMETPLIVTRHSLPARNRYFEIFTGHHRATVAAFLGIKRIRVAVLYDKRTQRNSVHVSRSQARMWRESRE